MPSSHPSRSGEAVSVVRNTFFLAVADVGGKVATFAFLVLSARRLGVNQFGVLSYAIAYTNMFAVLTDLGVGQLVGREVARGSARTREYLSVGLGLKFIAAVVAVTLAVAVSLLSEHTPQLTFVVALSALLLVDAALTSFFRPVLQGYERADILALGRLVQIVLLGASIAVLAVVQRGPMWYAGSFALAAVVAAVVTGAVTAARLQRLRPSFAFRPMGELLKASFPLGLAAALVMLYYWSGTTILGAVKGETSVGLYSAPYRLVVGISVLATAYGGAVYPILSRVHAFRRDDSPQLLWRVLHWAVVLALPVVVIGLGAPRGLLNLLYGPEYARASAVFGVLSLWAFLLFPNAVLSYYHIASHRPKVNAIQAGVSLAVCVVLTLLLVSALGPLGVAIALAAAEAMGLVVYAVSARGALLRASCVRAALPRMARAVLSGVLALAAAILLARVGLAFALAGGVTCYVGLLWAFRVLRGGDWRTLAYALRRGGSAR
jgi:O-antigen/teichoic acid export membrane protein